MLGQPEHNNGSLNIWKSPPCSFYRVSALDHKPNKTRSLAFLDSTGLARPTWAGGMAPPKEHLTHHPECKKVPSMHCSCGILTRRVSVYLTRRVSSLFYNLVKANFQPKIPKVDYLHRLSFRRPLKFLGLRHDKTLLWSKIAGGEKFCAWRYFFSPSHRLPFQNP